MSFKLLRGEKVLFKQIIGVIKTSVYSLPHVTLKNKQVGENKITVYFLKMIDMLQIFHMPPLTTF